MGLKDDFLEALSSVKKDIFNGSEDSEPDAQEYSVSEENSPMEYDDFEQMHSSPRAVANNPGDEIKPAPMDDKDVFDAFNQASVIDDDQSLSNDDGDFDNNDDNGLLHSGDEIFEAASPAPQSFRNYEPEEESSEASENEDAAVVDEMLSPSTVNDYPNAAPTLYDFDRTDLYSDDKTIISKNTVIRGAIQTDDSVRLLGQVHGDIDCKSNIVIAGKVRGNTSAANAYVMDAQVDGSVQCDDVVSVSSDAWVLGDIRAQQAEIDGKIKGNLDIRHAVSIGNTSSIIGNISTDELEIKRGAFINGQIMMYTPSRDVLDRFDHFEK